MNKAHIFQSTEAMPHLNLAGAELSGWKEIAKDSGKRVRSHSLYSLKIHPGDLDLRAARLPSYEGGAMAVLFTTLIFLFGEHSSVRMISGERSCSNCFELQSKWEVKS